MKKLVLILVVCWAFVANAQQVIIVDANWSDVKSALNSNFTELYNQSTIPASSGIDVYIENEILPACVQNTWYSPTTAQATGKLVVNFEYVAGELVYTGTEAIKVMLISSVSVNIAGGIRAEVDAASGKNGVIENIDIVPVTSTLNGKVSANVLGVFDLVTGDKLDFFFRQTSENGTPDITINKGRFTILKIG